MKLIEHSMLLGYVVAADYERGIVMYYTATASFSDEMINTLRSQFYGWGILLYDEPDKAKNFLNYYKGADLTEEIANHQEIKHAIDCVSAENI